MDTSNCWTPPTCAYVCRVTALVGTKSCCMITCGMSHTHTHTHTHTHMHTHAHTCTHSHYIHTHAHTHTSHRMWWRSGHCARGPGSTWNPSSARRTSCDSCQLRANATRPWIASGGRSWHLPSRIPRYLLSIRLGCVGFSSTWNTPMHTDLVHNFALT